MNTGHAVHLLYGCVVVGMWYTVAVVHLNMCTLYSLCVQRQACACYARYCDYAAWFVLMVQQHFHILY